MPQFLARYANHTDLMLFQMLDSAAPARFLLRSPLAAPMQKMLEAHCAMQAAKLRGMARELCGSVGRRR